MAQKVQGEMASTLISWGYWKTLKQDIIQVVQSFESIGKIPKGCNCSFIALISKVKDPTNLEEYRPISLVGAIYKIISKSSS